MALERKSSHSGIGSSSKHVGDIASFRFKRCDIATLRNESHVATLYNEGHVGDKSTEHVGDIASIRFKGCDIATLHNKSHVATLHNEGHVATVRDHSKEITAQQEGKENKTADKKSHIFQIPEEDSANNATLQNPDQESW